MLATQRGSAHYPSMLEDVDAHRPTEIELITGSLVREADAARRAGSAQHHCSTRSSEERKHRGRYPGTDRRAEMTKVRRATLALAAVAVVAVAVVAAARRLRRRRRSRSAGRTTASGTWRRSTARRSRRRSRTSRRSTRRADEGQAPHLQHAGQQARDREGVRAEAALAGRRRDHDHLRRRLRRAGRPGVDQRRQAHRRGLHRHRSDGPEALRAEGQARVLVRQRRAGRGLRDGRVRVEARAGAPRRSRRTR